ncbi:hypothetical protein FB45DRAFT_444064 [Roridomyces roridus]|uniref:DUF6534 domain-containing protein n=1 Tax=Roridomyces roridus TaxID=1738132 RepID=A0AAD7C0S2_9AGAR|nr:hypothetical protein FB45DRAFT_444064 [Roridomyces roridus]
MPPPPQFQQFTFDNTLGAALIGFSVSTLVFGVVLTQAWTYYTRFSSDSRWYRILVAVVILLESVDQAFIAHFVYHYLVSEVGHPEAVFLGTTTWSIIMQQALGSVVGTIVKCVFATRVYRFSERNIWITGTILLFSLGGLGVAFSFTVRAFQLGTLPEVFQLQTLVNTSLALSTCTDFITAAALCVYLRRLRTGHKDADSLVRTLVRDAINTGSVTSAVSLTTVLLFNFLPKNFIFASTYFLLSKLYAVSLLATLNSRRVVRGRGTDKNGGSTDYPARSQIHVMTRSLQDDTETNIFHLGTRVVPSMYDPDMSSPQTQWQYAYPSPVADFKPGFPPPSAASPSSSLYPSPPPRFQAV